MISKKDVDVLIIGAGPTGMTDAIALARHGLKVRIVDKADRHKQHSQAGVLWPRTQEVYAALGVLQPWQERATHLSHVSFYGYGRYLGDMPAFRTDSMYRRPMLIGQNETEEMLEHLCQQLGVPVERSVAATAFEDCGDGVIATLKYLSRGGLEESVSSAWLLATDGAGSTVRQWAGLSWDARRFQGQKVFQVDAVVRWDLPLEEGHAYFFLHDDGYFGCVPLLDGYHRFFISEPDSGGTNADDPKLEDMEARLTKMSGSEVHLSDPRWLSGKHYQNVITDTFRKGRMLLGGDAGKAVVPLNGQGMNTGIQDMFNLCWKLAFVHKGLAPDSLLDSYSAERYENAQHLVGVTGEYFVHVTQPSKFQEFLVRSAGSLVLESDWITNRYQMFASMLDVSYRETPGAFIGSSEDKHRGLQAGDRAPDAWIVDAASRKTVRLHDDVLSYSRFTLLLLSGEEDASSLEGFRRAYTSAIEPHRGLIACSNVVRRREQIATRLASNRGNLLDSQKALHSRYTNKGMTQF